MKILKSLILFLYLVFILCIWVVNVCAVAVYMLVIVIYEKTLNCLRIREDKNDRAM